MKVMNAFAQVFAIFSVLTLGSLMVIVAMHILSVDDAVLKLRELYHNPWQSIRTGFVGLLFILLGLSFAKALVKKGRQTDVLILPGENGPVVMSLVAIEDVARRIIKKFHLIKDAKVKAVVQGRTVEIKLRFVLWAGAKVPDLLIEVQSEIRSRILKLVGSEVCLEIACDVQKIEDHEVEGLHSQQTLSV